MKFRNARDYFKKACNLNSGIGCANLSTFYMEGRGGEQDYNKAKTYAEKACNLNDSQGCYVLGTI